MKNQKYNRAFSKCGITLFLSIIILLLFSPLSAFAAETETEQRDKIKVGFYAMDGYHIMDEKGNKSGYGYDLLRLMARYWNVDFEYVGYDKSWEEIQKLLENGEIDLVTAVRKTPDREIKFDFSKPIGSNDGILSVSWDNTSIIEGYYSTYNNMRVGFVSGSTRDDEFSSFALSKGFSYDPIYFETSQKLVNALQDGSVDAIATNSLRKINNERIIEKFAYGDSYVMIKKGRDELLDKINYAIDQMNAVEGDWKTALYNKNYNSLDNRNLEYTVEEKRIIAQYNKDNPLRILTDPTRYPYSFIENGDMKGILPDYFQKLAEYTGLEYVFVTPTTRDEFIAYQKNSDAVDIALDARFEDDNYAESKGWALTAPYISMQLARVNRRDFDGQIKVLATVEQNTVKAIEEGLAPGAKKIYCETRQDIMKAVRDGKADAAFVYYYMANEFINSDTTGTLTYTLLEKPVYSYRMVVSAKVNHALSGILTKAIYAMPSNLVEDLAANYTSYKAKDLNLVDFIRLHPVIALIIAMLFVGILFTLVLAILQLNSREKLQLETQQKANDMKELAEKAQEASRVKSTFLSNMSHDIRTPMNAIVGFTNIALHSDSVPEIHNCLKKIEESSDHLLSLINDVLDLSRIESGKVKLLPVPVDIATVTDSVIDIMNGLIVNRDLNFEVDREKLSNPYVLADSLRIKEVLFNILSNAQKFTKDGGSILFQTRKKAGCDDKHIVLCYCIKDTGVGMSEEFKKDLFKEFAQEDNGARTQYKGTGLGMAIAKKYVELMGGTITVESQKGVGTTITVEIPVEITDAEHVISQKQYSQSKNLEGIKVLLAEDNDLNAELGKMILEGYGMIVTRVTNGQEAIDAFEASPEGTFDVILMDIMMPVLDGHQAARIIRAISETRADSKPIPIIALSANAFAEDVQASLDAGMNAHISKPLNATEVINTIERNISI